MENEIPLDDQPTERDIARSIGGTIAFFCDPTEEGEAARKIVRNRIYAEGALNDVRKFGLGWTREARGFIAFGERRISDLVYGVINGVFSHHDVVAAQEAYKVQEE